MKVEAFRCQIMPLLAHVAIDLASTDEWQQKAKEAGAEGIQILGHVCEGQQLINYEGTHNQKAYGGQEGEWLSQEYLLATGVVDLFMFDYKGSRRNGCRKDCPDLC